MARSISWALSGALVTSASLMVFFGCGGDDNTKPNETPVITAGSGGDESGGSSGSGGSDADASSGGSGGTSGGTGGGGTSGGTGGGGSGGTTSVDGGDAGGSGGTVACDPTPGPNGCFPCPSTTLEFLNRCPAEGVQCAAFDNAVRLPLYNGGDLPAVP